MVRIGVPIGSNDVYLISFLKYLIQDGLLDYVELYIQPNITVKEVMTWREANLELNFHAPHDERAEMTLSYIQLAKQVRDLLNENGFIVANAGIENWEAFNKFDLGEDVLVENMPLFTTKGERGAFSKPTQAPKNFCLDIAHAYSTATLLHEDPIEFIRYFLAKEPKHLHVADMKDIHVDEYATMGKGRLPLKKIVPLLPDTTITVEVDHLASNREENIISDLKTFRQIIKYYK